MYLPRKDGTLDITRMSALVDQVADLHKQGRSGYHFPPLRRDEVRFVSKKLDAVSARQLYSAVGQANR